MIRNALRTLLAFSMITLLACAQDEGKFDAEAKAAAQALIDNLTGGNFAQRETAAVELQELPIDALPWLEEKLAASKATEVELRTRIKAVIRTLKKRQAETSLVSGSKVSLALESAKPNEVLEALSKQIGSTLNKESASNSAWGKPDPEPLAFEGSYWDAVDALIKTFPTKEGGRETLSQAYQFGRWQEGDFQHANKPHCNTGILKVRFARLALENTGKADALILNLVPNVEPCYQVEQLELLVKSITLEDGTAIEPEKKVCEWKADRNGSGYSPGANFTWVFPLEKGTRLRGAIKIDGAAQLEVRRLVWNKVELPEELHEAVKLNTNTELKVLERGDGRIKIQFEGKGKEPDSFDDWDMRRESYQLLDKDGKSLKFSVNSSSSGGGRGWKNSYSGKITGDPTHLRARLPSAKQTVRLDFDLEEIPLPGSTLAE